MPRIRGGVSLSPFDGRDVMWSGLDASESEAQLFRPPLKDQGNEVNACTAMALSTAMEIIDAKQNDYVELSPLFNYYYARRHPNSLGLVPMRFALQSAARDGIAPMEYHDYRSTIENARIRPSEEAISIARYHKIAFDAALGIPAYQHLDYADRANRWRSMLFGGLPVIAVVATQRSYWNGEGIIECGIEPSSGLHAVCIVGYDDNERVFYVRDSRGTRLTQNGEWLLGYKVVDSRQVAESWTIGMLNYDY